MTAKGSGRCVLEVRHVSVSFGAFRVVDDVSICVPVGEIVGLIGPNGAGKTTLFNVISGLVRPDSGSIVVAGHEVLGTDPAYRPMLGIYRTFQHGQLFESLTVAENLMGSEGFRGAKTSAGQFIGLPSARRALRAQRRRAKGIAETLGVSAWLNRPASELSSGNAKLVDFGRALVNDPKVLILDEPTVGLSPPAQSRLAGLLDAASERGTSVLVIEHDMAFLSTVADVVYAMDSGRIVTSGEPGCVLRHPDVLSAYLGDGDRFGPAARLGRVDGPQENQQTPDGRGRGACRGPER